MFGSSLLSVYRKRERRHKEPRSSRPMEHFPTEICIRANAAIYYIALVTLNTFSSTMRIKKYTEKSILIILFCSAREKTDFRPPFLVLLPAQLRSTRAALPLQTLQAVAKFCWRRSQYHPKAAVNRRRSLE